MKLHKLLALCAGVSLNLLFASALSANIVNNPGFEMGDLTGWTANPSPNGGFAWNVNDSSPHSGSYAASTGCIGATCVDQTNLSAAAYLYQDLGTTAGQSYDLSFYFNPGSGSPSELKVLWGGNVVLDLADISQGYAQYSVDDLVATSGTTQLMFLGRQDPSFGYLDDVDVEAGAASATPEPASFAMLGFGLLTVPAFRKLRNRK